MLQVGHAGTGGAVHRHCYPKNTAGSERANPQNPPTGLTEHVASLPSAGSMLIVFRRGRVLRFQKLVMLQSLLASKKVKPHSGNSSIAVEHACIECIAAEIA